MNDFPLADIIFFAVIAGFILLRLRSVLGKNTGFDARESARKMQESERVIQLADKEKPAEPEETLILTDIGDPKVSSGLIAIKAADPQFTMKDFMSGAKVAYEMVVEGFANNDKATLRHLLSDPLYNQFSAIIDGRQNQDEKHETTLVSFLHADITEAQLEKDTAKITVKFTTEQINLIRDKDGQVIKGNPSAVEKVEDVWTFERSVKSRNPNWKISDT